MYIDVDKGKLGFVKDEKLWGGVSTNQTLGENDALVPKVTSSYGGVTVSMKHTDSGSESTLITLIIHIEYNEIAGMVMKLHERYKITLTL